MKSENIGSDIGITCDQSRSPNNSEGKIVKRSKKEYDDLNNENDYLKKELHDARAEIVSYRKKIRR